MIKPKKILFSVSKCHNSKIRQSRITVLAFCMSSSVENICVKMV